MPALCDECSTTQLLDLPDAIIERVLRRCSVSDRCRLAQSCSALRGRAFPPAACQREIACGDCSCQRLCQHVAETGELVPGCSHASRAYAEPAGRSIRPLARPGARPPGSAAAGWAFAFPYSQEARVLCVLHHMSRQVRTPRSQLLPVEPPQLQ